MKTTLIELLGKVFDWSLRGRERKRSAFRAPWWLELRPGSRRLRRMYWEAVFGGLEAGVELGEGTKVVGPAGIQIGQGTRITSDVVLDGRGGLVIGSHTLIGFQSILLTYTHRFTEDRPVILQGMESAPVAVGDGVWLGTRVVVLPGTRIGDHAIIGACSVVTKDIPSRAIAAGNPARILRMRDGSRG